MHHLAASWQMNDTLSNKGLSIGKDNGVENELSQKIYVLDLYLLDVVSYT